jgi:hypothetical protein
MKKRLITALTTYVVLAGLAALTLDGKIRLATLVFLAGTAIRTYVWYLSSSN